MAGEQKSVGAKTPVCPAGDADLPLVERVLAGDKQAFESLVRRHEQRVYRTTTAITGNREDAEEATQETFLKAYQHLSEFRRASRFTTWLTRIAANEALQICRRRRPAVSLEESVMTDEDIMPKQFEDWRNDPEKSYTKEELRRVVDEAIQSLAPIYRTVLVLRDLQGLTTEEAAEALGLTIPALKSRVLRARLMMRDALTRRFAQPPSLGARVVRAARMMGTGVQLAVQRLRTPRGEVVMLDCKQVLAEVSNYLDDEVSPEIKRALEQHLAICHRCSLIFDTTRKTLRIVTEAGPLEVPLEVSVRLYKRLQELLAGK